MARKYPHSPPQTYGFIRNSRFYLAVFRECGNRGRFNVRPGDVLLHGAFDAHLDHIFVVGTEVLDLTLPGAGRDSTEHCPNFRRGHDYEGRQG